MSLMRSRTSAVVIAAVVTIMALVFAFTVSYSYDHNGMPTRGGFAHGLLTTCVQSRPTSCCFFVFARAPRVVFAVLRLFQ